MNDRSYLGRTFKIADPDSRIRKADDLLNFVTGEGGAPKTIANGKSVGVSNIKALPTGAKSVTIFVLATEVGGGSEIGWTSAGNLAGKFLTETIGTVLPPPNASRFGPNAAWENGTFLGQIKLVKVVGTNGEIEFVAESTCDRLLAMAAAARDDGRKIGVNSAFRSWPEQDHLRKGWDRRLPGFNAANRPGHSNHQNGIAFDLDVKPGEGNLDYEWLKRNATKFGFLRTVPTEAWHWEFRPQAAATARSRGKFSTF